MHFGNETNSVNSPMAEPDSSSDLLSYRVREIVIIITLVFLGQVICVVGMAGNIINIIVFVKHGFNDTINVSLVGLSMADIGALVSAQWFIFCVNPRFITADLPFLPLEIQSLTGGFPHVYFIRVSGFITAFVSFERCLCIVFPLKVKRIITKRVVMFFNIAIFFVMTLTVFPVYYTAYYDWKFNPFTNKTKLAIFYTSNKDDVLEVSLMITNFGVPLLSFFAIIVSTGITSFALKRKAKWRRTTSTAAMISRNDVSTKEKQVVVMITVVSVIFIISLLPLTMLLAARAVVPELNITGKYANVNWLVVSIAMLMEIINSTINSFIFYKMSIKYRDTIHAMFSFHKKLSCVNKLIQRY